jgi:biopolymer transport protein ExbD
MAFGGFSKASSSAPMAEINMVPLIDVMLVLLVIFIITAPLLTHAVKVELPRASSTPNITQPENVQLAVKANGEIYWNGQPIAAADLPERMLAAARLDPQPEVHLRADRTTEYEKVARVMSMAAKAGLTRIGFVTEPNVGE